MNRWSAFETPAVMPVANETHKLHSKQARAIRAETINNARCPEPQLDWQKIRQAKRKCEMCPVFDHLQCKCILNRLAHCPAVCPDIKLVLLTECVSDAYHSFQKRGGKT